MPKATLTYVLPEEAEEFRLAQNGADLEYSMNDFDNWLRAKVKHDNTLSEAEADLYQKVREEFWRCRNGG